MMMEYINNPEETANTLRRHPDGLKWLHTGDLGMMDADGFIYFRQRIKRMIVTSGYNVYPSQIENALDAHELVHMSCVIGVPDPYKMQRVVAFIVLKPDVKIPEDAAREILLAYCEKHGREIRDAEGNPLPRQSAQDAGWQGGLSGFGRGRSKELRVKNT